MTDNEEMQFEREKLCYEQNFLHARSLNEQMNRVPTLAVTITGGLWFGAGAAPSIDPYFRFALLLFAGFCNLALILTSLRIRDVLESYLEKIKAFHPAGFASGTPSTPKMALLRSYGMISVHCALIFMAGLLSWIGAFGIYWPFVAYPWWIGICSLLILLGGIAMIVRK